MKMWIIDMFSNLFMGNDYNHDAAQQLQQQMDQEMLDQHMQRQMEEMNDPYIHAGLDICVDESFHGIDHGGLHDFQEDINDQCSTAGYSNDDLSNDDGLSCNDDLSCEDDLYGTDECDHDDYCDDDGLDCSFDDWSFSDDW